MKTFLTCMFLFTTMAASAKEKNVSFLEFLELAKENDPNLSLIMADKERTKFLVDLGLPARQLLLQAQSEYGVSVKDKQTTNRNSANLSRNFLETGTVVSVGYTNNDLADRTEEVTEFTLTQALYRNLFGRYTRLQKKSLEDEAYSLSLQVVDTYENYLSQLGSLYLDYAQAWHNVDLAKRILAETEALQKNVEKMKKNNIASATDVDRAKLQVALRKEDLVNLESQLESLGARLIAAANLPQTIVRPNLDSFTVMLKSLQVEGIAYEELRVAKIAESNEQAADKRLKLSASLNDPALNLVLGHKIDESSRFGTSVNREEQVIGLQLEIPFGNTRNNALEKEAALEKLKSGIRKFGQKRDSMQRFQVLRVQLKNAKEVMELNQRKLSLSQKVYEGDLRRYQYGNLALDRLIEAKNAFSLHRYQLFASAANYYKIALSWLDISDRLVEKKS